MSLIRSNAVLFLVADTDSARALFSGNIAGDIAGGDATEGEVADGDVVDGEVAVSSCSIDWLMKVSIEITADPVASTPSNNTCARSQNFIGAFANRHASG